MEGPRAGRVWAWYDELGFGGCGANRGGSLTKKPRTLFSAGYTSMNEHESVPEKISISYEDLQAVPEVRIGSQTTVEPQGSGNTALPQGKRRKNKAVIFSLLGVILVLTVFVVLSLVLMQTGPDIDIVDSKPGEGLSRQQLSLASPHLMAGFAEEDVFGNDVTGWTGSCCVLAVDKSHLYLVTNAHCLGLDGLAQSDSGGSPEVSQFILQIEFPSGEQRLVEAFAHHKGSIDLALLKVNADGLVEGRDYLPLPHANDLKLSPLDKVVAVGNPHQLSGTITAGEISRVWQNGVPEKMRGYAIQHSAPINHGNSGGPLFIVEGGRYRWIGVNTRVEYESARPARADGIGFAIHVNEVLPTEIFSEWHTCDAAGAIKALRDHYGVHATDASSE